ncbi:MAG: hypothetical protein IPM52_05300 [Bacteroidetes bacterium]|nr:hypothetical protein [Bacteroidota bacterium]
MEISNSKGLKISVLPNGTVGEINHGKIRINLRPASIHGASGAGVYLRLHGEQMHLLALTGPTIKGSFGLSDNKLYWQTESDGLRCLTELKLSPDETAWMWSMIVSNTSHKQVTFDAICYQDAGLRQAAPLVNEYYVSQYTERRIFDSEFYGKVAVCRQHMREATGHPWLLMTSLEGAVAGATDGAQIFGPANRQSRFPHGLLAPVLSGEYAGESSLLALQSKAVTLNPGSGIVLRFLFIFMENHPEPSAETDLQFIRPVLGSFDAINPLPYLPWKQSPAISPFNPPHYAEARELTEDELNSYFGTERLHAEYHHARLHSFFAANGNHIVLKNKELFVDRPHGHIIRSGWGLLPDENIMSTNPFMAGVFNAHVTAGNTNFNVLHSVYSNQFGLPSPNGQRVFVKIHNRWLLLGLPSAFEMGFNYCRWIYHIEDIVVEVVTWTSTEIHRVNFRLRVLQGALTDFRITNHFDPGPNYTVSLNKNLGGCMYPDPDSLLGKQFPHSCFSARLDQFDGLVETLVEKTEGADGPLLVHVFTGCRNIQISFRFCPQGQSDDTQVAVFENEALPARSGFARLTGNLSLSGGHADIQALNTILPWYATNALTHYLTPYGLEQFGGAAWGTRDVSQGPVELLLSLGRYDEARQVLRTIFRNQHPDGGWPQWWMFDSYARIRAHEAHGDITYWVMIALANYLVQTGDYGFLDEQIAWYNPDIQVFESSDPLIQHVERWLKMITDSFLPGTSLVPFGGGDWNDSLQPASPELAARLISSWTVQMCYQAFRSLAAALKPTVHTALADRLIQLSTLVRNDFHKHLVKDGVVAGYGRLEDDGRISLLLHPEDQLTGIRYSILPMNRGVLSHIFDPVQAGNHLNIIEAHLKGPDGARLMDKPLKYSGGKMRIFQRAETSTYFGREIGLMYVHEHIRHAEALSLLGEAKAFVKALRQAIPVDYASIVTNAAPRQSNCYYSSSDIVFANRYEADEQYHLLNTGKFVLRGGWRVYSSGPGIFVALIITRLLGIRLTKNQLHIDPVMPKSFDGLEASFQLFGKPVTLKYHVKEREFGPQKILLNGRMLTFASERQLYRPGAAVFAADGIKLLFKEDHNLLEIYL